MLLCISFLVYCESTVSFAVCLHETIFPLYGGQSNDCSPIRYKIVFAKATSQSQACL